MVDSEHETLVSTCVKHVWSPVSVSVSVSVLLIPVIKHELLFLPDVHRNRIGTGCSSVRLNLIYVYFSFRSVCLLRSLANFIFTHTMGKIMAIPYHACTRTEKRVKLKDGPPVLILASNLQIINIKHVIDNNTTNMLSNSIILVSRFTFLLWNRMLD